MRSHATKWALVSRWGRAKRVRAYLLALLLLAALSTLAHAQSPLLGSAEALPDAPTSQQLADEPDTGTISGTVVDKDKAVIAKAKISLALRKSGDGTDRRETLSDSNGYFAFTNVPAGSFELTISASGFAMQKTSGVLQAGQTFLVPEIQLVVATEVNVQVTETQEQIAEEQIKVQETQRVLGVFPNYYVSYVPDAVPLNRRQKFQLAWKASINPYSVGIAAFFAGLEQANNSFSGYGQGAQGYAKRFGATYADSVAGTFIGGAILPSLLKQDPRYFYKGTGTRKSRILYAMAMAVVCKGDNGRWQPNYSNILGDLAAGGVSNLYYPASNRNGVGLTFENTAIGIGGSALSGIIQEFFLRRLTPHASAAPKSEE